MFIQPKSKKGISIVILVAAIVVVAGIGTYIVYLEHNKSDVLSGTITAPEYPIINSTLEVTLKNPSKLSNPYNVTMTLDLPNGQSAALYYLGYIEWKSNNFGALINIQQNESTDFVISTGTLIGLVDTANDNYNFTGVTFILTYTGYSGAITYTIK